MRRCHIDDCEQPARYGAKLDWTNQPTVLLCEDHAVTERQFHSVVEIATYPATKDPAP